MAEEPPFVDGSAGPTAPDVSPTPTAEEAAAIAAAVEAYLAGERTTAAGAEPGWAGRRWAFGGRLARRADGPVRIPEGAPTDPWTAADRADRF